jgi:4-amino-4-deoxy-L-arabinose transferase-like glycosyltransferase
LTDVLTAPDPAPVDAPAADPRRRIVTPARVGVALVIVAGVVLRWFVLTHSLGVLDSDEATTGLVARHILHNHEHPVFYWASNYGGTIEAATTAGAFLVLGSSVLVLKLSAIAWYAAACVLAWRVGRHLVDERAGAIAGLLMWVWPASFLWWSTKSRGFYSSVLVLALVMALTALRLTERPGHRVDWLIFGLAFGLAWWDTPQIVLLGIPIGLWVVMRNWRALKSAWLAIPTALLGASPWILWNVRHSFNSLDRASVPHPDTYSGILARFFREALPVSLGARVPYTLRWVVTDGNRLYVAFGLAVIGGVAYGTWRWRRRGGPELLVALALYPFLYALNPLAFSTSEGRYVFLLLPVLACSLAYLVRQWWLMAALLVAATALCVLGLSTMHDGNSPIPSDKPVPLHMGPLIRALDDEHVTTAFATYWIAYRLDFESNERITTAGAPYNRYPPYDVKVRTDPNPPAWIFVSGSKADGDFHTAIDNLNEPYRLRTVGGFSIYLPQHKLLPGQVPAGT